MLRKVLNKIIFKRIDCVCYAQEENLCNAMVGRRLRIKCLRGEDGVCERLREMGFCESAVVEKIADSGALICRVCDARVILSKGIAQNIIVKSICSCAGHGIFENKITVLSRMKVGQCGFIENDDSYSDADERLEEMGVTTGELIEVVRYAPLGDPIEIKIRGYLLSMRKQEADKIKIRLI